MVFNNCKLGVMPFLSCRRRPVRARPQPKQENRLGFEGGHAVMSHAFFQGMDWDHLERGTLSVSVSCLFVLEGWPYSAASSNSGNRGDFRVEEKGGVRIPCIPSPPVAHCSALNFRMAPTRRLKQTARNPSGYQPLWRCLRKHLQSALSVLSTTLC